MGKVLSVLAILVAMGGVSSAAFAQANDKSNPDTNTVASDDASIARGIVGGWGQNSGTANPNARSINLDGKAEARGSGNNRGKVGRGREKN